MKQLLNKEIEKYVYYIDENILILNGEVREILNKMNKEVIDLIVTSPPYNVGIEYSDWNDKLSLEEYFNFVEEFLYGFKKVLKKEGRFAINIPYDIKMKHVKKGRRLSMVGEYYCLLKKVGLEYNTIVHLHEDNPHRVKFTAFGSWLSASSPYIYNPLECILIGYKEVWKKLNKGKSTIDKSLFMETVKGIWNYKAELKKWTQANFSLDIPYKTIQILTYENDLIMDPFMGAGTTGVACMKTNRKFIGIDISKEYCQIAKERILNFNEIQ